MVIFNSYVKLLKFLDYQPMDWTRRLEGTSMPWIPQECHGLGIAAELCSSRSTCCPTFTKTRGGPIGAILNAGIMALDTFVCLKIGQKSLHSHMVFLFVHQCLSLSWCSEIINSRLDISKINSWCADAWGQRYADPDLGYYTCDDGVACLDGSREIATWRRVWTVHDRPLFVFYFV